MTSPLLDGRLVDKLVMLWLFAVRVSWLFGVGWLVSCSCALVVRCPLVVWDKDVDSEDVDDEDGCSVSVGHSIDLLV